MPRIAGQEHDGTVWPPVFHLRREEDFGSGCPMRCILVPYDGVVEVVVNTAHGWESYDHAAHHAHEAGLRPMVCSVDHPCGYAPAPPV